MLRGLLLLLFVERGVILEDVCFYFNVVCMCLFVDSWFYVYKVLNIFCLFYIVVFVFESLC